MIGEERRGEEEINDHKLTMGYDLLFIINAMDHYALISLFLGNIGLTILW